MRGISPVIAIIIIGLVATVAAVITWYEINQSQTIEFKWSITNMKVMTTWTGYVTKKTTIDIMGLHNPDKNSIEDYWDEKAVAVKGIAVLMYNVVLFPWRVCIYTGTKVKEEPWWSGDYYKIYITTDAHSRDRITKTESSRIFEIEYSCEDDVKANLGVLIDQLKQAGFTVSVLSNGNIKISTNKYSNNTITLHLEGYMEKWEKSNPFSKHLVATKDFDLKQTYHVITLW